MTFNWGSCSACFYRVRAAPAAAWYSGASRIIADAGDHYIQLEESGAAMTVLEHVVEADRWHACDRTR